MFIPQISAITLQTAGRCFSRSHRARHAVVTDRHIHCQLHIQFNCTHRNRYTIELSNCRCTHITWHSDMKHNTSCYDCLWNALFIVWLVKCRIEFTVHTLSTVCPVYIGCTLHTVRTVCTVCTVHTVCTASKLRTACTVRKLCTLCTVCTVCTYAQYTHYAQYAQYSPQTSLHHSHISTAINQSIHSHTTDITDIIPVNTNSSINTFCCAVLMMIEVGRNM